MKITLIDILIVLGIILLVGFVALMPKFEKDAFNKFRDPNESKATYWDAVVSDLRITSE